MEGGAEPSHFIYNPMWRFPFLFRISHGEPFKGCLHSVNTTISDLSSLTCFNPVLFGWELSLTTSRALAPNQYDAEGTRMEKRNRQVSSLVV
jgi:hypothetical protein